LSDGNLVLDLQYLAYELGPGEIGEFPRLRDIPDEFIHPSAIVVDAKCREAPEKLNVGIIVGIAVRGVVLAGLFTSSF
jgi:hypothetical protein